MQFNRGGKEGEKREGEEKGALLSVSWQLV